MRVTVGSRRIEQIYGCSIIPTLEDDACHELVMFRVSEFGWYRGMLGIKLTGTDFQGKKEKSFSFCEARVVLAYHGTPFVRCRFQTARALLPLGQVQQHVWEEVASRVGGLDGRNDRLG